MKSTVFVITLILSVLLLSASTATSQEWGEVTDAEWQIGPPPDYPQSGAVVIFDIGQATAEIRGLTLERHVRMKVFSDDGVKDIEKVEIEHFYYDKLFDLKAQVIRPDGSSVKFDKDDFEITKKGAVRIATFRFSNVRAGDILEYQYKIDYYGGFDKLGPEKYFLFSQEVRYSQYRARKERVMYVWDSDKLKNVSNIPTWFFDHPVFCLSSTFSAKLGSDLDYVFFTTNVPANKVEPVSKRIKFMTATAYKRHTWQLENIRPFIPDSSDIYSEEVRRSALYFQLLSTQGQNRVIHAVCADKHLQYLGESFQGYLHEYVATTKKMRNLARKLAGAGETPRQKAEIIYDWVVSNYSVDSSGYVLRPTQKNLKKVFTDKEAAPFELNILLVEMLKIVGFDAWQVLISTRDKLPFRYTGKFNHMLALVDIEGERVLLDASGKGCPFGLLPSPSVVAKGVLVDYNNSRPIGISGQECKTEM
ncbi:MAG: DUF3857 and transglutaminase domain-containing protein [Candidatus Zixiibacteriota bacterium]|nr:MAG: DUF3857 and transglutaminase domain-containing protein [candidate division Zixibacteria bacterium]